MRLSGFIILLFSILFLLPACGSDDDTVIIDDGPATANYGPGVYVVNRGNANTDTKGDISFYDRENQMVTNGIFAANNSTVELGSEVHSMTVAGNRAYIVSSDQNRVVIVNKRTFRRFGEIINLNRPRYVLPVNDNKILISEWGEDGATGAIKVVNLTSLAITNTIPTRPGPEQMVKVDSCVYVANSGGFVLDSVVTKIDLVTESVTATIAAGPAPRSLVVDRDNNVWSLSNGVFDEDNPSLNRKGKLIKIVQDFPVLNLDVNTGADRLVANQEGDKLYFTMDGWVFEHPIEQLTISMVPFIERFFLTIGIDPETDRFYGADAGNTQQDGQVFIYNSSGSELGSFDVGVVPFNFWFEQSE